MSDQIIPGGWGLDQPPVETEGRSGLSVLGAKPCRREVMCHEEASWALANTPVKSELHPYASESWFTESGARIKARRLQKAGLPDFTNWRFITLTAANRAISPQAAYQTGKDRMRRFLARFRQALGYSFRWCWKLEFHDDGYAHWHLLVDYTKRIPREMLPNLEKWWNLGRVNVRRVKGRDIRYVFKYVSKAPEDLPQWVLEFEGTMRVFQTSRGFYTAKPPRKIQKREPQFCRIKVDLITRQTWDGRKGRLVSELLNGHFRTRTVKLRKPFSDLLLMQAHQSLHQRQQLAPPGVVSISQRQLSEINHEHKRYPGLAIIPPQKTAA